MTGPSMLFKFTLPADAIPLHVRRRAPQDWLRDILTTAFPAHPLDECTVVPSWRPDQQAGPGNSAVTRWTLTLASTPTVLRFAAQLFDVPDATTVRLEQLIERGLERVKPMREGAIVPLPFRVALDWYMVSDPWPLDEEAHEAVGMILEARAQELGYDGWVDAYHEGGTVDPGARTAMQALEAVGLDPSPPCTTHSAAGARRPGQVLVIGICGHTGDELEGMNAEDTARHDIEGCWLPGYEGKAKMADARPLRPRAAERSADASVDVTTLSDEDLDREIGFVGSGAGIVPGWREALLAERRRRGPVGSWTCEECRQAITGQFSQSDEHLPSCSLYLQAGS